MYSFDSLYEGYLRARKRKRFYKDVLEFSSNIEDNIISIQNELIWKTWEPSPCRTFVVFEPKERVITAPAFRDRVVHHSLVSVIEPLFERKFIYNSFACRKGKGTHAAQNAVFSYLREMSRGGKDVWVLQTDIKKYFASIDHEILMSIISRTISDRDVLWLIGQVVRNSGFTGVGLPVGALTSQLCANIYLDQLDHYLVDNVGVSPYIRYMDDALVFSHSKSYLEKVYRIIIDFVQDHLALSLNTKSGIYKSNQGIDFCGYRIWTTHRLPRKRNVTRMRRRMKKLCKMYRRGVIPAENVRAAWASFLGYMKHCDGYRTKLLMWKELIEILRRDKLHDLDA